MKTENLIQGSAEWLAHRAAHFNASDAPAMMNASAYKTRSELLREYATGIATEVDAATQRRFDEGHRIEALARTLAEEIIGQDLYPVTGHEGRYSASFDGITMDEGDVFEHKSLNDALRAVMVDGCTGADLPLMYRVQMEQQCLVSGCARVLFMASKWDGDTLVEERHCWYSPNLDLRQQLVDGWAQFEKDLAAYVPPVVVEKPKAEAIMELPALFLHARGEITSSNMEEFSKALAVSLDAARRQVLVTDQDFANAEAAAKQYRETCKKLMLAKDGMLAQTVSIGEAARMIDAWHEDLRVTALKLEKDVEREKDAKKLAIINAARVAYAEHIADLDKEIAPARLALTAPDFAGAMKGKRLLSAWQDAVDSELARAKIAADSAARAIRANLEVFRAAAVGYEFLFADLSQLVTKAADDFALVVKTRVDARVAAENKAKEEADAAAKASTEVKTSAAHQPAPSVTQAITPSIAVTATNSAPFALTAPSATRTQINVYLDRLNEADLTRVLHFCQSRFETALAA